MDERNNHFDFDFTPIGQAIKKAREAKGMTREQLSPALVSGGTMLSTQSSKKKAIMAVTKSA